MGLVLPTIEAYQVQHLPIVKAYADKIGLVEAINQLVPTEMAAGHRGAFGRSRQVSQPAYTPSAGTAIPAWIGTLAVG